MNWLDLAKIFAVAGIITGVLSPIIGRLCFRYGFLDLPGEHKRHRFPTPNLGGLAIFSGFWLAVGFAYLSFPAVPQEFGRFLYFVFAGAVIIFLTGLIDDIADVSAPVKLVSQIAVGLILYLGGLRITVLFIPIYGPVALGILSCPITLLWMVGVTNSINLIDGLDGLAAGVSAIAALAILFVGIAFHLMTVMVFTAAMIGACLVFLYFNFYPARLFMGNSGSLFLGYLFAVISMLFPIKSYTTAAVFVPLLALGVPVIETVVSFVRRTARGTMFYRADNRHLFHYLSASGLSKSQVVWLFYFLSAVFAVSSGAMFLFERRTVFTLLLVFMVVIFGVLSRFVITYARRNGKDKRP